MHDFQLFLPLFGAKSSDLVRKTYCNDRHILELLNYLAVEKWRDYRYPPYKKIGDGLLPILRYIP